MRCSNIIIGAILALGLFSANGYSQTASPPEKKATTKKTDKKIKTDFVFLIDVSPSMEPHIQAVRRGLTSFVNKLREENVDAVFAVTTFGGTPRLIQDFTPDISTIASAFENSVNINGGKMGGGNISRGTEAGLHALRTIVGEEKTTKNIDSDSSFDNILSQFGLGMKTGSRKSQQNRYPVLGGLKFRPESRINIILVTDENSDKYGTPKQEQLFGGQMSTGRTTGSGMSPGNRMPGGNMTGFLMQGNPGNTGNSSMMSGGGGMNMGSLLRSIASGNIEPTFDMNTADFGRGKSKDPIPVSEQEEIDRTAKAMLKHRAFVNMVIDPADHPSTYQYGDPAQEVSAGNKMNFNPDATLKKLESSKAKRSLEAQLLKSGLIGRTFNVNEVASGNFVNNLFAAKVEETTKYPVTSKPQQGCTGTSANTFSERTAMLNINCDKK